MAGKVDRMTPPSLAGWIPIRVYWHQGRPQVDWCYLGRERRLTEPFFNDTIDAQLRSPFHLLFRHQTSVETLLAWQEQQPGIRPSGFVFHMSRCGSTLIAQMLAALPCNVVLSEPMPLDGMLQARAHAPEISDAERCTWLRALVSALGQRWGGRETHLFVKLDSSHTLHLPLIRQAFPDVPWIFVYREPVEVLVSQMKERAAQTVPGMIDPALLGLDLATAVQLPPEAYCARYLGRLCEAALAMHGNGGMLVNYGELPEVVCNSICRFFQVPCPAADAEAMQQVARVDAKVPSQPFSNDSANKQGAATAMVRGMAQTWIQPVYEGLEIARRARHASK
jgi:hypothetical protein